MLAFRWWDVVPDNSGGLLLLLLLLFRCAVIGEGFGTGQLPFGPKLTFALNLGNLVPMLMGRV